MEARAFVFATRPGDYYRAGRTIRSLQAAGIEAEEIGERALDSFDAILMGGAPVLFLRAGAWLARPEGFGFPRPSATGKGLCALGAVRVPPECGPAGADYAADWREILDETGGNLSGLRDVRLPEPAALSLYLDAVGAKALAEEGNSSFEEILRRAFRKLRVVHFAPLDVYKDDNLRVLQVITSLQRGGAERMTLDLMARLPAHNVRARLVTLGRPLREAFPSPPGTVHLASATQNSRGAPGRVDAHGKGIWSRHGPRPSIDGQ